MQKKFVVVQKNCQITTVNIYLHIFALQNVASFVNKNCGYRMMPGYKRKMKPLREDCHPEFIVSEDGEMASCGLQELANHTATRLFLDPECIKVVE